MPKNKKPAGGRPAKNFEPRYGAKKTGGPSAGSRSPGHRGFRAESTEAPSKNRWNSEDRDARRGAPAGERPAYGDRAPRGDRSERPAYGDRAPRGDRPSYGDRNERPAYNRGERSERPSYGDRAPRGDRPSYGDRNERPAYNRGERSERPAFNRGGDRPAYGDRTERPRFDRDAPRGERPSYGDRAPRGDRPSYGDRNERPAYNRGERSERPAFNRGERSERPSYGDRNDRPAYNRGERSERPAFGDRAPRGDRPSYGDRNDRPARNFGGDRPRYNKDEAPRRSASDFYPAKDEKARFTPEEDVVLERLEAQATTAADVDGVSFADLGLGDNICRQLASMGAAAPFAIQAATIPDVLAGKDVLGRGKTGSGKTIAFGSPVVERLMENNGGKDRKQGRAPRALIMAPTRELAMQIDRTVQPIARSVGLFTTTIFGGVPQHKQVMSLRRGVDIIIATPGRLEDLVEQGHIDLRNITITVLDEADHMCDLGFLEPVQRILRATKADGQRLLFSATLDKGVAAIVKEFLKDPAVHEVAGEDQASSTIDHRVLVVEHRDKPMVIEQLASREGKTLIFARTRAYAEQLADQLEDAGIPATSLHGDLNQSRRTRNLQLLTSGRVNVLVATDVAARGIHVDDIDLVIQADAPDEYKTYMHRSGRTGRAGKQGTVVTIIPRTRQRRMNELLGRAEISAEMIPAQPGDELLDQLASSNA
ncbi:superfamily II DNA/RNA helicase [Aurantimicrobium minutum]|uniref:DEAD/DEAH box helicase n=1 Tax=Aurantimicrobium minutum TaxID=708131 RepID=UPI00247623B9|nr:DEAD/DEAH box helicase [Aurantimicrobium minutum]MDH6277778.1 superfamily II DNA/RNA helicase [Aurantimicrobium minutum]